MGEPNGTADSGRNHDERKRSTVAYVAVGSNIEPEANIVRAIEALGRLTDVEAASTFFRTSPIDRPGQPMFLNGVLRVRTERSSIDLKRNILRRIETELGRKRSADRSAARVIDLDLILYGEEVIDRPGLRLPDPEIRSRSFVAVPLLELDPNLVMPDTGERLADLPSAHADPDLEVAADLTRRLQQKVKR